MPASPRILCCLPDTDFDPTEAATPWHRLREAGFRVTFATESGKPAHCDQLMIGGPFFGQLGAQPEAVERYHRMVQSHEFQQPVAWQQASLDGLAALVLPGGHAQGMKPYLESAAVHGLAVAAFARGLLVGAICHGVVVLARSLDPATGKSVLHDRRCTALPKSLERAGWLLTFWKLGNYYRTYPIYVQDEVEAVLARKDQFSAGRASWIPFVVRDRNLVTARWPKDAELFAAELIHALAERRTS